jgi:hypothetical protein
LILRKQFSAQRTILVEFAVSSVVLLCWWAGWSTSAARSMSKRYFPTQHGRGAARRVVRRLEPFHPNLYDAEIKAAVDAELAAVICPPLKNPVTPAPTSPTERRAQPALRVHGVSLDPVSVVYICYNDTPDSTSPVRRPTRASAI